MCLFYSCSLIVQHVDRNAGAWNEIMFGGGNEVTKVDFTEASAYMKSTVHIRHLQNSLCRLRLDTVFLRKPKGKAELMCNALIMEIQ